MTFFPKIFLKSDLKMSEIPPTSFLHRTYRLIKLIKPPFSARRSIMQHKLSYKSKKIKFDSTSITDRND